MLNFKEKSPQTSASAKVVDGKLILSFPQAKTPVVWTMDVAKAKASAMEVLEKGDKGEHTLTLKSAAGEVIEVATFPNREAALEGLMLTADALENARGHIRGGSAGVANDAPAKKAKLKKPKNPAQTKSRLMGAAASLVFLVVMITIWSFVMPRSYYTGDRYGSAPTPDSNLSAANANADPQNSAGVPVSADAFFKRPIKRISHEYEDQPFHF